MIKDIDFNVTSYPDFKAKIDKDLQSMVKRFYKNVPGADYLKDSKEINVDYYKRSIVEIILRLRMKRTIDALTIHHFTKYNPFLAKKWAQYTEDEMLHDKMFSADIERLGMTTEDIYTTDPYFSTKLLQGYFYYGIEHEGKPLASLVSSYFIEKMSLLTQPDWMENVERVLGKGSAKGHIAHIQHDIEDDHSDFVWNVVSTFIESDKDMEKVSEHLENIFQLFCMYYTEIYNDFFLKSSKSTAA
jgi:hypothetical protein